jgi:GNAT superfamily N-acetyltransferase
MKKEIQNNLFEFWKEIGNLTGNLIEENNFYSVLDEESDWPNRVFNFSTDVNTLASIVDLKNRNVLPAGLAIDGTINLRKDKRFEFVYNQINMSLNLEKHECIDFSEKNIKRVDTSYLGNIFAKVASASFGYNVNYKTILKIIDSKNIDLYLYKIVDNFLCCGIIFYDSLNNAGLHMIGTVPDERGKGIGKQMTQKLINEAKSKNKSYRVLHASKMGKPIYLKLGFKEYGDIKTYRIL